MNFYIKSRLETAMAGEQYEVNVQWTFGKILTQ